MNGSFQLSFNDDMRSRSFQLSGMKIGTPGRMRWESGATAEHRAVPQRTICRASSSLEEPHFSTLALHTGPSDPIYDPGSHTAMIPQAGKLGWTYADERLLLLHELGHAFDYALMKPGDRVRFRKLARRNRPP